MLFSSTIQIKLNGLRKTNILSLKVMNFRMKKIISEKFPRILKNKRRLEKELGIKISHRGKEVFFSGNPENEYVTEKVFDALEFGFPFSVALEISNEDLMFEVINIKSSLLISNATLNGKPNSSASKTFSVTYSFSGFPEKKTSFPR